MYATVMQREQEERLVTIGKRMESKRVEKRIRVKIQKVRQPVHFTSVTPTWKPFSGCVQFGRGPCRWRGLGIEIMTATWRVVSAGGCRKTNRFSGLSRKMGRATWP